MCSYCWRERMREWKRSWPNHIRVACNVEHLIQRPHVFYRTKKIHTTALTIDISMWAHRQHYAAVHQCPVRLHRIQLRVGGWTMCRWQCWRMLREVVRKKGNILENVRGTKVLKWPSSTMSFGSTLSSVLWCCTSALLYYVVHDVVWRLCHLCHGNECDLDVFYFVRINVCVCFPEDAVMFTCASSYHPTLSILCSQVCSWFNTICARNKRNKGCAVGAQNGNPATIESSRLCAHNERRAHPERKCEMECSCGWNAVQPEWLRRRWRYFSSYGSWIHL